MFLHNRLMERNEHLTQESAEILAVRGTAPVENGKNYHCSYICTCTLQSLEIEYFLIASS